MQNHDLAKFSAMLIGIGEIYGKATSEVIIDLYWRSLKCFELKDLKQAFQDHMHNPDSGQFFPKPADIVRMIEGSSETKAANAWAKVYKAIGQIGSYQSVVFDDHLIHAVIDDIGGWVKLCNTSINDLSFMAHEFQKRYMAFLHQPPDRYPKYCCGFFENASVNHGSQSKPQLLFVGDLKKAKQVFLNGSNLRILIHADNIIKNLEQ